MWKSYDKCIDLGGGLKPEQCQGEYAYMRDFLRFDSRRAAVTLVEIPRELGQLKTLLWVQECNRSFVAHPDRNFCNYLLGVKNFL